MENHKENIISYYNSGYNCADIAKKYGVSHATIFRWLKKWGINTRIHILGKNINILEHKNEIIAAYNSGLNCSEIAKKYNLNGHVIFRWLKKWGIQTSKNKYLFNNKQSIRENRSRITKEMFNNGAYKKFIKIGIEYSKSDKNRISTSKRSKKMWQDCTMRAKLTNIARENWYKNKQWEKMQCFKNTKPEIAVENALIYLDIPYKKHYQIDKYNVDFLIGNTLLDIDGEYWHGRLSKEHEQVKYVATKDVNKLNYLNSLNKYKYIRWWETATFDRTNLISRLSKLLDIKINKIDFNVNDIIIEEINTQQCNEFVELFHYYGSIRNTIICHGAFINNKLIGIAAYSTPNYNNEQNKCFLELSRFCLDPRYQIKNCASKFLSLSLKRINKEIISFADTTQGHDGTVYKACNFIKIGESSGSYYYVDEYNNKFHKKVIYNQARSLKYSEKEYAKLTNLKKIKEKKKIKYLWTP